MISAVTSKNYVSPSQLVKQMKQRNYVAAQKAFRELHAHQVACEYDLKAKRIQKAIEKQSRPA